MTWFKVDDKLWGHPEWQAASDGAKALYVTAGSWCGDQLTDGAVPRHMLAALRGKPRFAAELVLRGFWNESETGWMFTAWTRDQPTREDVERDREATRIRQARFRETARQRREEGQRNAVTESVTSGGSNPLRNAVTNSVSNTPPDPTRPDPTVVPTELLSGGAAPLRPATQKPPRGSRLPEPFEVTPEMRQWASANVQGIDVELVTENFRDYWRAQPGQLGVKLDWVATWRRWLRTDHSRNAARQRPRQTGPRILRPAAGGRFVEE